MSELRSAVIGVGLAGENHLRALTALGLLVTGVLASRPGRTAEAAARWRVRGYADLSDLLADPEVTLVHVCTPPSSHRALVEAVLEAGRAVLCEKPLGMTHAEALALARKAERSGQPAWVGFNRRFDEGVQALREAVAAGELGEPLDVWGSYSQQWNAEPSSFDWRFDPAVVGRTRVVGDIGAHWLDLATHVTGRRLRRVCAMLTHPRGARVFQPGGGYGAQRMVPTNEDAFASLLELEGDVTGVVHATQLAYGSWDDIALRVDGSRRSGWWDSRHPNQVSFADKERGVVVMGLDSPGRSFEAMLGEIHAQTESAIAATFEEARHINAAIDAVLDSGAHRLGWVDVERPLAEEAGT
ncbi:Gfo/Idh/MocA family oxidoreductase [soil metagenome]